MLGIEEDDPDYSENYDLKKEIESMTDRNFAGWTDVGETEVTVPLILNFIAALCSKNLDDEMSFKTSADEKVTIVN